MVPVNEQKSLETFCVKFWEYTVFKFVQNNLIPLKNLSEIKIYILLFKNPVPRSAVMSACAI